MENGFAPASSRATPRRSSGASRPGGGRTASRRRAQRSTRSTVARVTRRQHRERLRRRLREHVEVATEFAPLAVDLGESPRAQHARIAAIRSRTISPRFSGSTPNAAYSGSRSPEATPGTTRPSESRSTVAADFARWIGCRSGGRRSTCRARPPRCGRPRARAAPTGRTPRRRRRTGASRSARPRPEPVEAEGSRRAPRAGPPRVGSGVPRRSPVSGNPSPNVSPPPNSRRKPALAWPSRAPASRSVTVPSPRRCRVCAPIAALVAARARRRFPSRRRRFRRPRRTRSIGIPTTRATRRRFRRTRHRPPRGAVRAERLAAYRGRREPSDERRRRHRDGGPRHSDCHEGGAGRAQREEGTPPPRHRRPRPSGGRRPVRAARRRVPRTPPYAYEAAARPVRRRAAAAFQREVQREGLARPEADAGEVRGQWREEDAEAGEHDENGREVRRKRRREAIDEHPGTESPRVEPGRSEREGGAADVEPRRLADAAAEPRGAQFRHCPGVRWKRSRGQRETGGGARGAHEQERALGGDRIVPQRHDCGNDESQPDRPAQPSRFPDTRSVGR